MLLATLLSLFLTSLTQGDASFAVDLWPGEGRPVIESLTSELHLREQPVGSARTAVRWPATPGQQLEFDETLLRTTRPGQMHAVVRTTVTGRHLGEIRTLSRADYYSASFPRTTISLKAGDAIEYLQYRAEGTCFVRIAGVVFDTDPCPRESDDAFRLVREPVVEWWVRLLSDGKPVGWLLLNDKIARVVRREFGEARGMEDWVEVRNCAWLHEAQFLGSVLDSAGIEWLIPDEYTIGVHPGFIPALGGIRLLVHAEDVESAQALLDGTEGVPPKSNDG